MSQIILEGSWEEVAQRASEFEGKRVVLIVLESAAQNGNQAHFEGRPLLEALEELVGVIDSREPAASFPQKKSEWGEIITEKFRKQGLKLP
ncbi:MAG: hypothetical protein JMDDDDMK_02016 [Acidobacteria bacterium]|nr:hypothetical protein [Acidobacteriota bacterium]